jgi:hypothetical protein
VKIAGLLGDGFGATPEMSKRKLIWVVCKIQLLVEHYPSWYIYLLTKLYNFVPKRILKFAFLQQFHSYSNPFGTRA